MDNEIRSDQELVRREKAEKIREMGIDTFGHVFNRTHFSLDIKLGVQTWDDHLKDIPARIAYLSKTTTMIKLYEENQNFCPKCRINRTDTTIHCIICDRCIKDFDHHCYILNICICEKNMALYKKLIYLILAYLIYNILYFSYSK